jgi:hypothetical protein
MKKSPRAAASARLSSQFRPSRAVTRRHRIASSTPPEHRATYVRRDPRPQRRGSAPARAWRAQPARGVRPLQGSASPRGRPRSSASRAVGDVEREGPEVLVEDGHAAAGRVTPHLGQDRSLAGTWSRTVTAKVTSNGPARTGARGHRRGGTSAPHRRRRLWPGAGLPRGARGWIDADDLAASDARRASRRTTPVPTRRSPAAWTDVGQRWEPWRSAFDEAGRLGPRGLGEQPRSGCRSTAR